LLTAAYDIQRPWPADKVERWAIDRLIPYAKNARTHTDAQVAAIAASIKEWGWTTPALVGEDGGLIAGHARILAARQLGIAEIPVMVAAGWSEAQKRAYVSGAEWTRAQVAAGRRRIALVAPTAADARDVMVEGESGILAVSPDLARPIYEPSKRRLTWPNGAIATTYSADEPERLRGPQHDAAWCDELGAWRYPEAWDMLMFGLRLGHDPRVMVTTTPRPTKLIKELVADPTVAISRGTTYQNRKNLAGAFLQQIVKKYEGTRLGRQELNAELLEDVPGALWNRALIEAARSPIGFVLPDLAPPSTRARARANEAATPTIVARTR
jgi:phage terminase large subunit-like protein